MKKNQPFSLGFFTITLIQFSENALSVNFTCIQEIVFDVWGWLKTSMAIISIQCLIHSKLQKWKTFLPEKERRASYIIHIQGSLQYSQGGGEMSSTHFLLLIPHKN
jgi:hypothetical protein